MWKVCVTKTTLNASKSHVISSYYSHILMCTPYNLVEDHPCADCRKFFDGSGGNNCAVDHFKEGRGGGPLAVKLGTITRSHFKNMVAI